MRYIKKIDSIPLVDGGNVINSLSTNDNHDTNAPSLSLLESRTDGNLLFNGSFSGSLGWTFTADSGISASSFSLFTIFGARFNPGCAGVLESRDFFPVSSPSQDIVYRNPGITNKKFSLSIVYVLMDTTSRSEFITAEAKIGKMENIHVSAVGPQTSSIYIVNEDGVVITLTSLMSNLKVRVNNGSSKYLYILHMRLEEGKTATPVCYPSKDASIVSLINDNLQKYPTNHLLPNNTDLNSFTSIKRNGWWLVDSDHYSYSNLPTGFHGNGFLEVVSVAKSATVTSTDGNAYLQVLHDQYSRNIFVRRGWGTDTIQWVPWKKYGAGPKIMKWGAPSTVIRAHTSAYVYGNVEMSGYTDGYTAKGVVSVILQGDVCVSGFDLFNDPNDGNKRKVRIFVFNPTDSDVLIQPQVGIIYDTV